jgi:hypothetical protein
MQTAGLFETLVPINRVSSLTVIGTLKLINAFRCYVSRFCRLHLNLLLKKYICQCFVPMVSAQHHFTFKKRNGMETKFG